MENNDDKIVDQVGIVKNQEWPLGTTEWKSFFHSHPTEMRQITLGIMAKFFNNFVVGGWAADCQMEWHIDTIPLYCLPVEITG